MQTGKDYLTIRLNDYIGISMDNNFFARLLVTEMTNNPAAGEWNFDFDSFGGDPNEDELVIQAMQKMLNETKFFTVDYKARAMHAHPVVEFYISVKLTQKGEDEVNFTRYRQIK